MCVHVHALVHVCVCVCVHACAYTCAYLCMCVCVCVCVCVWMCVRAHTHTLSFHNPTKQKNYKSDNLTLVQKDLQKDIKQ